MMQLTFQPAVPVLSPSFLIRTNSHVRPCTLTEISQSWSHSWHGKAPFPGRHVYYQHCTVSMSAPSMETAAAKSSKASINPSSAATPAIASGQEASVPSETLDARKFYALTNKEYLDLPLNILLNTIAKLKHDGSAPSTSTSTIISTPVTHFNKFNSFSLPRHQSPTSQRITLTDLRLLTRGTVDADNVDLSGDDDQDTLTVSFYSTLVVSVLLAIAAQQYLVGWVDDVTRWATVVAVGALPYGFLTLGISAPRVLQGWIVAVRRGVSEEYRERLCRHEAGHFLVGYVLGIPVKGYALDSILNAVAFYSEDEIKAASSSSSSLSQQQDQQELSPTALLARNYSLYNLAIVSVSGIVAELIEYGDALGGYADMTQLQSIVNQKRGEAPTNDREEINLIRWACVMAYTILQKHKKSWDALTIAMAENASVPACIKAIELAEK